MKLRTQMNVKTQSNKSIENWKKKKLNQKIMKSVTYMECVKMRWKD